MPFLRMGKYKVVVSSKSNRITSELASTEFAYFPVMNFGWAFFGVMVLAGTLVDVCRRRKVHPAWWLAVPAFLGLTLYVLLSQSGPLGTMALAELGSLTAFLGLLGLCRRARRWLCLWIGLVLNILVTSLSVWATVGNIETPAAIPGISSLLVALWFVPAAVAVLLLRRKFSLRRYFNRMLVVWLIAAAVVGGIVIVMNGMPGLVEMVMVSTMMLLLPLPFVIGLLLLIGFNPWCRRQFLLAMGLEQMANKLPPPFALPDESHPAQALASAADGMNSGDDPWVIVEPPHEVDDQAEANTQKPEESY